MADDPGRAVGRGSEVNLRFAICDFSSTTDLTDSTDKDRNLQFLIRDIRVISGLCHCSHRSIMMKEPEGAIRVLYLRSQ